MKTVVGLFETRNEVVGAVEALKASGFDPEQMSVVMKDRQDAAVVAETTGVVDHSGDATASGAGLGGLLGGLAGLALGAGVLMIPGIGPILAAGPIAAMLTGGALGAATGGILGALTEAGLSEEDAADYQAGVEHGGVLLTIHAPAAREAEVRQILEDSGLRDLDHHRVRWPARGPKFHPDVELQDPTL